MYKEEIVTDKSRALALIDWKPDLLFWRDENGVPHHATKSKVEFSWKMIDFFTCTHPNPVQKKPITVKFLIGANAYACIEEGGRKTDILLSPGKGAPASLRDYANDQRERAARLIEMAELAERAAVELESSK